MTHIVVWLARHPLPAVLLVLAVLGGASWGIVHAVGVPEQRPAPLLLSESGVARSVPPEPDQVAPQARVDQAHQALHAIDRACTQPVATREPEAVSRPMAVIVAFARDYPGGGFRIDDESASALTLLLVVRNELEACDPALIPQLDGSIPRAYRPG